MNASLSIQLLAAAADGNRHRVSTLLFQGADDSYFQRADRAGLTPLHLAAQNGHTDVVELLLGQGGKAYINATDQHGQTALHHAAEMGHAGVIRALLAAGAKIDIRDKNDYTPLDLAVKFDQATQTSALTRQGDITVEQRLSEHPHRNTEDSLLILLEHAVKEIRENKSRHAPPAPATSQQAKLLLQAAITEQKGLETAGVER